MDYQKMYDDLIAFRQTNTPEGYVERHHIVMRSMGGSDNKSNLVALTGREHWIAHLLLHKIYRNEKTVHACHMMAMRCEERGIPYVRNSHMYEKIRKECSILLSQRNSYTHKGEGNSQYGTRWICNLELQENRKISKDESIPDGWILGRNKWNFKERSKLGSDEYKMKLSVAASKRTHSIETIEKISLAASNRKNLPNDILDKMYASRRGKTRSIESKKRMSDSQLKRAFV